MFGAILILVNSITLKNTLLTGLYISFKSFVRFSVALLLKIFTLKEFNLLLFILRATLLKGLKNFLD
jgi:hypothetical protein